MEDSLVEFLSESKELLIEVAIKLSALQDNPDDNELAETLFRHLHTIKGACGFYGLDEFEKLVHAAETQLSNFKASRSSHRNDKIFLLQTAIARLHLALKDIELKHAENSASDFQRHDSRAEGIDNSDAERARSPNSATNTTAPPAHSLINELEVPLDQLVQIQNELSSLAAADNGAPLLPMIDALCEVTNEIQTKLLSKNYRPLSDAWSELHLLIDNISKSINKSVCLYVEPTKLSVSKEAVSLIKAALTQIVRNSCDHGIESPDQRIACGKSKVGQISIRTQIENETITIEVEDDGRGLDLPTIRKQIAKNRHVPFSSLAALTDEQILDFVFANGFTTTQLPSRVSGRGVGMDIVRSNIVRLGGSVTLNSTWGKGTKIKLRFPQESRRTTSLTDMVG